MEYLLANPIGPEQRGSATARAARDQRTVHVPNTSGDPDFGSGPFSAAQSNRTVLSVPLLRQGETIGIITLDRLSVRPFTEKQINLVETFADQAVIAINNAQLFRELEARNQELNASLEQQMATAELLKVIGRSTFEIQPVFDTLAENTVRLCEAERAFIFRFDGEFLRVVATHSVQAEFRTWVEQHPIAPGRHSATARTALERRTIHIPDVMTDPEYTYGAKQVDPIRTVLTVPMLRAGELLGVLLTYRNEVRPFTDNQIALLETFADQAAIAIENTRLFEAEQANKRELEEALEYQTAISEVLGVISRSPTNVQPVFDTIAASALRLCRAKWSVVTRFDGQLLHLEAHHNLSDPAVVESGQRLFPRPLTRGGPTDRAIISGTVSHVPDVLEDAEYTFQAISREAGYRSHLSVPMVRDRQAIGAITVAGKSPVAFSERQVRLLEAFADQAVIAIENARLLDELQARQKDLARSVEELSSLGEVGRTVSSTLDLSRVLRTVVEQASAMSYAAGGAIYVFDKGKGEFHLEAGHNMSDEHMARVRSQPIHLGDPVVGECGVRREAVQVEDLTRLTSTPLLDVLLRAGARAILAVPLLHQGELIGALAVRRNQVGGFSSEIVRLVESFAAQSAIAIYNARLFEEIEARTKELQEALERQTATAEVLQVISESPADVQPVLDVVAKRAAELCEADWDTVWLVAGSSLRLAAHSPRDPDPQPGRGTRDPRDAAAGGQPKRAGRRARHRGACGRHRAAAGYRVWGCARDAAPFWLSHSARRANDARRLGHRSHRPEPA